MGVDHNPHIACDKRCRRRKPVAVAQRTTRLEGVAARRASIRCTTGRHLGDRGQGSCIHRGQSELDKTPVRPACVRQPHQTGSARAPHRNFGPAGAGGRSQVRCGARCGVELGVVWSYVRCVELGVVWS